MYLCKQEGVDILKDLEYDPLMANWIMNRRVYLLIGYTQNWVYNQNTQIFRRTKKVKNECGITTLDNRKNTFVVY